MARQLRCFVLIIIAILVLIAPLSQARVVWDKEGQQEYKQKSNLILNLPPSEKRHITVHDAGNLYGMFSDAIISNSGNNTVDPETGNFAEGFIYPQGSGKHHLFLGAIWIGGIVGGDTLVSVAHDIWIGEYEILQEDYPDGSSYRTGNFADDEFITNSVDTIIDGGIGNITPMGLKLTRTTYSWVDSLYDDFILIEYQIENISDQPIQDGWVGFILDGDVYQEANAPYGFSDDLTGALDTLLYDNDPLSHKVIPYIIDNDGDPMFDEFWDESSISSGISMSVLGASFEITEQNFNWWIPNGNHSLDYGPRQLGSGEDPFRPFTNGNLGTPMTDPDKYYILSHPEVDFDQIESAVHDSSDGWIPGMPLTMEDFANGYDTRFLLSFGAFDLAPGESESFTVAIVVAGDIHTGPTNFVDLFDANNPEPFSSTLDFSNLLEYHRRADAVYQSGLTLPIPGPPVGLVIDWFSDEEVALRWSSSSRPDLEGYFAYYKDTLVDNIWHRATALPVSDSTYVYSVPDPQHEYQFAVTTVSTASGESLLSDSVSVYPGRPDSIENLLATVGEYRLPELSWTASSDPAVGLYRIYRSIWDGEFALHDSTDMNSFSDFDSESGIKYNYKVSAVNDWGLESELSGSVYAVPMAMNQGVLFANYNYDGSSNLIAYNPEYMEHLYQSLASSSSITVGYRDWSTDFGMSEDRFKEMANYELVVFDLESRYSHFLEGKLDFYRLYLESGGKAIFISLSAAPRSAPQEIEKYNYSPGDFYYDILKLDSAVCNPMVFSSTPPNFPGDLMGCQSESVNYPHLVADTVKLRNCPVPGDEYIPMAGYMFPTEEAEVLYRYQSSDIDTINNNQVNGIRYLGDDFQFVFFNFQLSLMTEDASFNALHQAIYDLGINMNCGDVNVSSSTNVGDIVFLIQHVFYNTPPDLPAPANADVNCDGFINVGDAVSVINFVFKGGYLDCCND